MSKKPKECIVNGIDMKKLCRKDGCACPEAHIMYGKIANTDLHMRLYFEEVGRRGARREIRIKFEKLKSGFLVIFYRKTEWEAEKVGEKVGENEARILDLENGLALRIFMDDESAKQMMDIIQNKLNARGVF